ncbi:MAG: 30S ribosomal protein S15 [Pedosphaera sp.]|nr:30S ribosomal protein S15 [Pedosphaera sp.]
MTLSESTRACRRNEKDTGSSDVQIALLSDRIKQVESHLLSHKKDISSRRGLRLMVARRKRLLGFLNRTQHERFAFVKQKLGLR